MSHIVVKQLQGGDDPRFILMAEIEIGGTGNGGGVVFTPVSTEMTLQDTCLALLGRGIADADAKALIDEARRGYRP